MTAVAQFFWARLAPLDPRRGNVAKKYGYGGTIYQGGERPTWYKVSPALAAKLRELPQPSGDPRAPQLFEVYSDDERGNVDSIEEERVLVRMGLMAATATPFASAQASQMDLTSGDVRGVPLEGRGTAIPAPLTVDSPPPVTVRSLAPEAAPDGADGGNTTTQTLPGRRRRGRPAGA